MLLRLNPWDRENKARAQPERDAQSPLRHSASEMLRIDTLDCEGARGKAMMLQIF